MFPCEPMAIMPPCSTPSQQILYVRSSPSYSVKSDEMLLTVHRWFARKSCPGNWLFGKLDDLALEVNSRLEE